MLGLIVAIEIALSIWPMRDQTLESDFGPIGTVLLILGTSSHIGLLLSGCLTAVDGCQIWQHALVDPIFGCYTSVDACWPSEATW